MDGMGAAEAACEVVLAAALVVAAGVDLRRRIVPDGCVVAVALSGAVRAALRTAASAGGGAGGGGASVSAPVEAALGAVVVLAAMLLAARLSRRGDGSAGVGGGDVKLLGAVGVWTGPLAGLLAVMASCLVSVAGWAVLGLARLAAGALRRRADVRTAFPPSLPLAPGIALAALVLVCGRG